MRPSKHKPGSFFLNITVCHCAHRSLNSHFLCGLFVVEMTPWWHITGVFTITAQIQIQECCSAVQSGLFARDPGQNISSKIKSGHPHASDSATVCARGFLVPPEVQQAALRDREGGGLTSLQTNRPFQLHPIFYGNSLLDGFKVPAHNIVPA